MRFLRRTPVRTFVIYPLLVILWELIWNRGSIAIQPLFLPLMVWGYLQYRLCGLYRIKYGGGGPGLETPPQRLVATGPYAYTRNPMYLGHLIYLLGLSLTLQSWFGAAITLAIALWFHRRVTGDEKKLVARLGKPYVDYMNSVKRWLPGLI
ncbi:MAG: hypothetical protein GEU77_02500 [Deltaproteobacteria bacterium]|nr:hypothetical protein [Deltaproteobacteria bacterium]